MLFEKWETNQNEVHKAEPALLEKQIGVTMYVN
jgi:hypothetical protein